VNILNRLLWLEPFWILLLGIPLLLPGRFVPLPYHPYIVGGLFLFWPMRWLLWGMAPIQNQPARRSSLFGPSLLPLLCLLAWLPVNLWASVELDTSWVAVGYLLFGVALYFALLLWPLTRRSPWCIALFLLISISGLAVAVLPIVDWKAEYRLFYLPIYDQFQALEIDIGETIHANILAGVVVIALPLLFALSLDRAWAPDAWLYYSCVIVTIVLFLILILTQSRGGYLAIGIAFSIVVMLVWQQWWQFILFGLLLCSVVGYWAASSMFWELFQVSETVGGWNVRFDIWFYSLQAIFAFPVTGIGIGTFVTIMPLLYPLTYPIEGYPHAHNLFFQIAIDLGLPGLVAYLAFLLTVGVMLVRILRSSLQNSLLKLLTIGASGSLVAMLVHGQLDAASWGTKLAFFPWVLYALITTLFLRYCESESSFSTPAPQS
jgi:putative inorganic carbon (HCO3(-)) transporter